MRQCGTCHGFGTVRSISGGIDACPVCTRQAEQEYRLLRENMRQAMKKRIVAILPDGLDGNVTRWTEREIEPGDKLPDMEQMRTLIGGVIEPVRVLRADLPGFIYTYMLVDEEGLIKKLPRNPKATTLYLANLTRAYPGLTPAAARQRAQAEQDRSYREATWRPVTRIENPNTPPGYHDDPYIAGPAVWFDGWTCHQLIEAGL